MDQKIRHLRYPCDTLARGGVSKNNCCVSMLIAQFWHLRYLSGSFYFLAQEKNFCPFRCRILNCVKNVATGLIKRHVLLNFLCPRKEEKVSLQLTLPIYLIQKSEWSGWIAPGTLAGLLTKSLIK